MELPIAGVKSLPSLKADRVRFIIPRMLEALAVVLFGLVIGSFLNVCIHRLPRGESVVSPRSRCPRCGRLIPAWENIPLLSYVMLRGRCGGCRAPIGWIYPAVEILTPVALYLLYLKFGLSIPLAVNALLFCLLIVLAFIDLFQRILPDVLTLGGTAAAFLLSPWQAAEFMGAGPFWSRLLQAFIGAAIGGGVLWLVAALYFRVKKVEGMGFGDVKMMAMVGAFLGWRLAWLTILLGSLAGALIGAGYMLATSKGRRYELPFGTFLAFGAIASVLWGNDLLAWYFRFLR